MPVEAAVRQPGVLHEIGHADTLDTVLTDATSRRLHDAVVAAGLGCLRMAHPKVLSFGLTVRIMSVINPLWMIFIIQNGTGRP